MSEAQSLLVKYDWNPAWQEKWGLSSGDTEQCTCVLCVLWSYTLQRRASHSAMIARHTVFHKWAPVLAGEWQATGSVRICRWWWWWWGVGTHRSRLRQGFLTASAKPGDTPVKLLDFLHHTHTDTHILSANSQCLVHSSMWCRVGFKDWCVFHYNSSHRKGQEGLIQTGWLLSFHSFSPLFLFVFPRFSVSLRLTFS